MGEEKLGDCEKRRRRKGRRRGRASYIDEGRARRLPRDHTVESGGARPSWGEGGRIGASKQKGDGVAPSKMRPESNAWNAALAIAPCPGRRARCGLRLLSLARHGPCAEHQTPTRPPSPPGPAWIAMPTASCSCRAVYFNMPKIPSNVHLFMARHCHLRCLSLATSPVHGHCTQHTEGAANLNTPHVTRHSYG